MSQPPRQNDKPSRYAAQLTRLGFTPFPEEAEAYAKRRQELRNAQFQIDEKLQMLTPAQRRRARRQMSRPAFYHAHTDAGSPYTVARDEKGNSWIAYVHITLVHLKFDDITHLVSLAKTYPPLPKPLDN